MEAGAIGGTFGTGTGFERNGPVTTVRTGACRSFGVKLRLRGVFLRRAAMSVRAEAQTSHYLGIACSAIILIGSPRAVRLWQEAGRFCVHPRRRTISEGLQGCVVESLHSCWPRQVSVSRVRANR
jgi:hypothetical protein